MFESLCESLPGGPPSPEQRQALWESHAQAGNQAVQYLGPMHNAATWVGLLSLLSTEGPTAVGKSVAIFSYGSGMCSSMLVARVRALPGMTDISTALAERTPLGLTKMFEVVQAQKKSTTQLGLELPLSKAQGQLRPGTYHLVEVSNGKRTYARVPGTVQAATHMMPVQGAAV